MVHGDGCILDLSMYFRVCALKVPWPTENKMLIHGNNCFLISQSYNQLYWIEVAAVCTGTDFMLLSKNKLLIASLDKI